MEEIRNYIGGELIPSRAEAWLPNVDPSTGAVYSQVPDSDDADVAQAVEAARLAFPYWSGLPAAERGRALRRVAEVLRRDLHALARAESIDNGKPVQLA